MNTRRGYAALLLSIAAERFGFYGFVSILILDQVRRGIAEGDAKKAVATVLAAVYGLTFLGGYTGQKLGFRNVGLVGLALCSGAYFGLQAGLDMIVWAPLLAVGIGLYKPTMPILVSLVNPSNGAMAQFYAAVNVGGFGGPLLMGYLASRGRFGLAFLLSAVCCWLSQATLVWGGRALSRQAEQEIVVGKLLSLGTHETGTSRRDKVVGIWLLCLFALIFWSGYHAFFGSVEHLIETEVDRSVAGFVVPTAWFNAENGGIILLAGVVWPLLFARWRFSSRLAASLVCSAGSFGLLVWAQRTGYLVAAVPAAAVLVETFGELLISPLGLRMVTLLSPAGTVGLYTALWYLTSSVGGWLSGQLSHLTITLLSAAGALLVLPFYRRLERAAAVVADPPHAPSTVTDTSRSTSSTLARSPARTSMESCSEV